LSPGRAKLYFKLWRTCKRIIFFYVKRRAAKKFFFKKFQLRYQKIWTGSRSFKNSGKYFFFELLIMKNVLLREQRASIHPLTLQAPGLTIRDHKQHRNRFAFSSLLPTHRIDFFSKQNKFNRINSGTLFRRLRYYKKYFFLEGSTLVFIVRQFEFSIISLKSYMVISRFVKIRGNTVRRSWTPKIANSVYLITHI